MPITLSYDASGIRVDQISSWVGLGWNLNSGGMVTRKVLGVPDDVPLTYNAYSQEILDFVDYAKSNGVHEGALHDNVDNLLSYFTWVDKFNEKKADFQPDVYPFSVNGLSGTIFIDRETRIAKCIEHPNLIINYIGTETNISGWEITTPEGIKYTLSETETTHNWYSGTVSRMFEPSRNLEYNHVYISGWKLTRIFDFKTKRVITFSYSPKTWHETELLSLEGPNTITEETACQQGKTTVIKPRSEYQSTLSTNEYKILSSYLEEITFTGGNIKFFLAENDRLDYQNKKALKKIEVYNNYSKINTFLFHNDSYFGDMSAYTSNQNDQRYLRLKLDSLSIGNNLNKKYKFDYFTPEDVPERHSTSVDFWGYYNLQSNGTLIPEIQLSNSSLSGANRDANLQGSKTGTLKKLTYPTGGFTEFEYELHSFPSEIDNTRTETFGTQIHLGQTDPYYPNFCDDNPSNPKYETGSFIIRPDELNGLVTLRIVNSKPQETSGGNQAQSFVIYKTLNEEDLACRSENDPYQCATGTPLDYCEDLHNGHPSIVRRGVYNVGGGTSVVDEVLSGTRYDYQGNIIDYAPYLEPGAYHVYLFNNNPNVTMSINKSADLVIEGDDAIANGYTGGLRIKTMSDFGSETEVATRKAYIYDDIMSDSLRPNVADILNINSSSGVNHQYLDFYKTISNRTYSLVNLGNFCPSTYYCTTTSHNRSPNNRARISPYNVAYSHVTELRYSENEVQPNGLAIYDFYNDVEENRYSQFSKTKMLNGKIIKERYYAIENNHFKQLEEKNYLYSKHGSLSDLAYGMYFDQGSRTFSATRVVKQTSDGKYYYVFEDYNACDPPVGEYLLTGEGIPDYSAKFYTATSYWTKLNKTIEKSFLSDEVTLEKTFYYDNDIHKQITREVTKSSNGNSIITKTYYPDDVTDITSLGYDDLDSNIELPTINELKVQHRISEPIQVETTVKDGATVLSQSVQRTNYKEWHPDIVLPKDVQTLKGTYNASSNVLQDRVVFHSYDTNGNLKEVSKKDGAKIVYIWGYNEQYPIAKIENATYSEVSGQVANLQALSNADNDRTIGSSGNEGALRDALTTLRNTAALSDALVTTYTYDPLIGVTSITDPSGQTVYYHYDSFNRLEMVTDKDNKVLSKNQYHYKN